MLRASTVLLRRSLPVANAIPQRGMAKPGFFRQVYENFRQEIDKNKEMKENLKKFKEEAAKLEQAEALQKARRKFRTIEEESSSKLSENLSKFKDQIGETMEKSGIGEEVSKTAEAAKKTISDFAQKSDEILSKSETLKVVTESIERPQIYQAPTVLLKRSDLSAHHKDMVFEPNTEAQGVELHKDSKWSQGWESFKNSNPYVNKIMDLRTQLEESENPMIRASRAVTSKVSDLFGGLFEATEMSQVHTEICKVDPNFDMGSFRRTCETLFIPTILESIIRPDLAVLKDWTYEGVFNVLAKPLQAGLERKVTFASKVLDVENVEIAMGKMMEQGPVLIVTFQSQQIMCIKDSKGFVLEGDPDKIQRVYHVWCLCRDPSELNPLAAWRIIDLSMQSTEQFI